MKRMWLPLALAALAFAAIAAAATADDVRGPACADIVVTDANGVTTAGAYTTRNRAGEPIAPTLFFRLATAASSCKQVTYTVHVVDLNLLDANGNPTEIASQSLTGTGAPLSFEFPIPGGPSSICVYLTSSVGNHVFDRAPDNGCVEIPLDSTTPPGNFFE